MVNRKKIFRVLSLVLWALIFSGVVFVLVSAVQKEQKNICKEVLINIDESNGYKMINESEILSALWPENKGSIPQGKAVASFDLFNLERQVEKNPWVQSANIYFDTKQRMNIGVTQKMAVARIFTSDGNSYYLDSNFFLLPIKGDQVVSMPVFTNFYINPIKTSNQDSNTMSRIVSLARYISTDSFWMAQIESVNINSDNTFELITQVGNHRVVLGVRDDWNRLFKKLTALYSSMIENDSWDKYAMVDLQFTDQVVCTRKGYISVAKDSITQLDSAVVIPVKQDTAKVKSVTVPKQKKQ